MRQLAQRRGEEAMFRSRVPIDIQAESLVLESSPYLNFLKVQIEFPLLYLKQKASLFHLNLDVRGRMREEHSHIRHRGGPRESTPPTGVPARAAEPFLDLGLDLSIVSGWAEIGGICASSVDKIISDCSVPLGHQYRIGTITIHG